MKKREKTNPRLVSLVSSLKAASRQTGRNVWRDVAERLEKPLRRRPEVNLSRINRYTQENEIVVVPGKVLGAGVMDHRVTVAAFAFTREAKEKIAESGGRCLSLEELLEQGDVRGLRVMG